MPRRVLDDRHFCQQLTFPTALLLTLCVAACGAPDISVNRNPATDTSPDTARAKVVFLAGIDSHGPKAHEHQAGSELLADALRTQQPGFETINVYGGWPDDESVFSDVNAVVLYCDGGKKHLINEHVGSFNKLVASGVGVVALHYAVEVPRGGDSADAMLRAVGGYFETDWSVNPHWEANFLTLPEHPITAGVQPFAMQDEWYFNMRFLPDPAGITPILSAVAPSHTMKRRNGPHSGNEAVRKLVAARVPQVTAWAYERQGGGRGFGFTGGHFHANWQDDSARNLVLNAIVWSTEY